MNFTIDTYPVLPLRDLVVFPGMIVPLFVGREKSIKALEGAVKTGNKILLVAQMDAVTDDPNTKDLYKIGVIGNILQVLKLQDNTVKVLVEGKQRVKIIKYLEETPFIQAQIKPLMDDGEVNAPELPAMRRSTAKLFETYVQLNTKISPDVLNSISTIEDPAKFADAISAHLFVKVASKQEVLEQTNVQKKLEKLMVLLDLEIDLLNTESRIKTRVRTQIEKNQKDYYLNEQLKAIHKELGEEDYKEEVNDLSKKIAALQLSKEVKDRADAELKKLKLMNPMSSEAAVIRNYLDWIIQLPWKQHSKLNKNIGKAQAILDKEHYGLEKIKERILEYLAVNLRTNKLKSPILCLIGPPGVGKTSLARSIANTTGREFVKVSLGGLRDEAEIKGHRRTYIGAMPGKIIQGMKKAKKSNPVMLLDEIDKMGSDYRGDPSSAMLEILDPEQNHTFNDHYLEVDYDLSQVMFVATANSYEGIPRPLYDRMEVINLSGYTENEKLAIAENYLIPKQLEGHGVKKGELEITKESVVEIIRYYTREAGVRSLDRNIAKLARKVIKEIMLKGKKHVTVTAKNIHDFLGVRKYTYGEIEKKNLVGVTTGLAYTEVGGDLLSIEALLLYGKGGDIKITGKLGEVMKESVQAALSYIRARAVDYGIKPSVFKHKDMHIHVPEGATPKDGPSAGIAMCTSMVSALTGIPVRRDIAMTGEVTLRGRVLPIGGLKEKLLAALRGGVKTVLIPKENVKDLEEIPDVVKKGMKIIPVESVDEVLKHALSKTLIPIEWDEAKEIEAEKCRDKGNNMTAQLPH
jgi:ATP-dependent Lon protease